MVFIATTATVDEWSKIEEDARVDDYVNKYGTDKVKLGGDANLSGSRDLTVVMLTDVWDMG